MTSSGTRCTIVLAAYTDDLIVSGRREEAWVCFWEIHSHFGFSKGSINNPYGRSVLGMELVRGPRETGRRSLFLHQSGYVLKICEEYAKEAGISGGVTSLRRFSTPMKLRPDAADAAKQTRPGRYQDAAPKHVGRLLWAVRG